VGALRYGTRPCKALDTTARPSRGNRGRLVGRFWTWTARTRPDLDSHDEKTCSGHPTSGVKLMANRFWSPHQFEVTCPWPAAAAGAEHLPLIDLLNSLSSHRRNRPTVLPPRGRT
jgi:hypothetical protein